MLLIHSVRHFFLKALPTALLLANCILAIKPSWAQSAYCGPNARVQPAISADSPPQSFTYVYDVVDEACGLGLPCSFSSYSFSPRQSWTAMTGTTFMPLLNAGGSLVGQAAISTYSIDVKGLKPGTYCAHYGFAYSGEGPVRCHINGFTGQQECTCQYPDDRPFDYVSAGTICHFSNAWDVVDQVTVTVASAKVTLIDPVPDLVNGASVLGSNQLAGMLTEGQTTTGTAADGVTQLIVRISTNSPGEQFRLTLLNDQNGPGDPNEDGALGNPGDTTFSANQLNTAAIPSVPGQPAYAFAIFRAPIDFARKTTSGYKSGNCSGTIDTDDRLICRAVFIQIQDITANQSVGTLPISIVRAPVVLVHGLWSNPDETWKNFFPLVTGPKSSDVRFRITRVDYSGDVGHPITSSDPPSYDPELLQGARNNSLGFEWNARKARDKIARDIRKFRAGANPIGLPVGAAQADVVAHSMGGLITRAMALDTTPTGFLQSENFNQGYVHKLITIDTPHLGSGVATQLLLQQETGECLQPLLAWSGSFTFKTVTLLDVGPVNGAVGDLVDNGQSAILQRLANTVTHQIPTSMVAGVYTSWSSLDDTFGWATVIRNYPVGCPSDPLAQKLTSTAWPTVFASQPNDGVVQKISQLNDLSPSPGSVFGGTGGAGGASFTHSQGLLKLGFVAPTVLNSGPVPAEVIYRLNRSVSDTLYYYKLNP